MIRTTVQFVARLFRRQWSRDGTKAAAPQSPEARPLRLSDLRAAKRPESIDPLPERGHPRWRRWR